MNLCSQYYRPYLFLPLCEHLSLLYELLIIIWSIPVIGVTIAQEVLFVMRNLPKFLYLQLLTHADLFNTLSSFMNI